MADNKKNTERIETIKTIDNEDLEKVNGGCAPLGYTYCPKCHLKFFETTKGKCDKCGYRE